MPILVNGRWQPKMDGRTDFGFFMGLYDPVVRSVIAYLYSQHLQFRIWAPDFGIKLAMTVAGETEPDERLEQMSALMAWLPAELELPIVGNTNGRIFATNDLVAYFAYRDGGGSDNPAGYCGRNLWRRGGTC